MRRYGFCFWFLKRIFFATPKSFGFSKTSVRFGSFSISVQFFGFKPNRPHRYNVHNFVHRTLYTIWVLNLDAINSHNTVCYFMRANRPLRSLEGSSAPLPAHLFGRGGWGITDYPIQGNLCMWKIPKEIQIIYRCGTEGGNRRRERE